MCTSTFTEPPGGEPSDARLLRVAEEALAGLAREPLGGAVGDDGLVASVERLQRLEARVAAEKLRRVAELDARQAYRGQGARSTADLLARRLKVTPGEAKAQADTAAALELLPETAKALQQGDIGVGQAEVAAKAAADVHPGDRDQLDELVAREGARGDRRRLREQVRAWERTREGDALGERERRAHARRYLSMRDDDGSVTGSFRLDPLAGATLGAAIGALARKQSADDARTPGQRRADALVELAGKALDGGGLPEVAVQRPHVILLVPGRRAGARPDGGTPADGPWLDGYGPVSSLTAQMVCCDAEITPVVVTRNGEVLDLGKTDKPSRKLRVAIVARDRRCVGCGAPAARCQIHHIIWRSQAGRTDESNLCLVCANCHFHIHHHGWVVTRDATGRYRAGPASEAPSSWPLAS